MNKRAPKSIIKDILSRLVDYAIDLSFEWSWKRDHPGCHQEDYDRLKATITDAKQIGDKLTEIDKIDIDHHDTGETFD